jgi:hypothetical protein
VLATTDYSISVFHALKDQLQYAIGHEKVEIMQMAGVINSNKYRVVVAVMSHSHCFFEPTDLRMNWDW